MKRILTAIVFAIGVAATLSAQEEWEENPPYGKYDFGDGLVGLFTIEDFNRAMNDAKNKIEDIESAAAQQKAKIDTLWTEANNLVNGLKEDVGKLTDLVKRDTEGGGFQTKNDFDEWLKDTYETKTKDYDTKLTKKLDSDSLSDYAKKIDLYDYAKDSRLTKVDDDLKVWKSSVLEMFGSVRDRLTSLENRPIGGGGAGCGEDCKTSIRRLSEYLGDSLTVAESGSTGSCVTVTTSGTLFDSVLNKLPICYYGSVFEVGSSAPKQIFEDAELTIPAFGAADIWAGEGLEAALPTGPTVKKQLNVKVKNPGDFNARTLAQMLDGDTTEQNADGVAYADVSGVAAVDGEGHLRLIEIGSASFGIDDHTIVREKKKADQEDSPLVLKAKIANMVDGDTITTDGEGGAAKAKVNVDALCDDETIETSASDTLQVRTAGIVDDDTIGVNASNKLYVKKSGIKVIGTDDSTNWSGDDTPAQTITFKSESDSNVKVTVTGDKTSATVTIGVYYK